MSRRRGRRNTLPRLSSPRGVQARLALRLKRHAAVRSVGKDSSKGYKKPGSMNPRKVGR